MPYYKGVFFKELPPWAAKKKISEDLPVAVSNPEPVSTAPLAQPVTFDSVTSLQQPELVEDEQESINADSLDPQVDLAEVPKEAPAPKRRKKKASVDV